ncbi:MAG: hypothetical protein Q7S02_01525, partial [bacterium]|nr:hypothetical protein [bacterium]
ATAAQWLHMFHEEHGLETGSLGLVAAVVDAGTGETLASVGAMANHPEFGGGGVTALSREMQIIQEAALLDSHGVHVSPPITDE